MNKLLILADDAEEYVNLIETAGLQQLEIVMASEPGRAMELASDCNIIFGEPSLISGVLSSAEGLEWVQSSWAGVELLCKTGMRQDYVLTSAKGIFGDQISEYAMSYLFAFERKIFNMQANQQRKRWQPIGYRPSREITLGMVGLGSIGRQVARTARHFGIRVIGLNHSGNPCSEVEEVYTADSLSEFLAEPDYVLITLPGTPQTRHYFNADVLAMMKPSSILINVGRGSVVNENDLVQALQQDIIGGAVLDVFESEPLEKSSPLWDMPNVFITPHCAAITFPGQIVDIFVENYRRFIQQDPMLHVVDFGMGY